MIWQTSRRTIDLTRPIAMGILNVTPDSFSDGGEFKSPDNAVRRAEVMIAEGASIIDIGGESTRPGSERVTAEAEIERVVPVIAAITSRYDVPLSIDTSKADVARAAVDAGAEIINDISGLRWDAEIADVAAASGAGLILMHSRGEFQTMHSGPPVDNILTEVASGFEKALETARSRGVRDEQIVLDIGIGFGKTPEQNLELLAKLDRLVSEFAKFPVLVGTSRKSFIGKILGGVPPDQRLSGSLATTSIAAWNGAKILRVHDVRQTVETLAMVEAIRGQL